MAFNPFNWFRKHQKKLIVVVTVFVMFIFIVSFGRGDLLDWIGMKASRGVQGPVVCEMKLMHASSHPDLSGSSRLRFWKDKTNIHDGDLSRISRQRNAASLFILTQAFDHQNKTLDELLKKDLKPDPESSSLHVMQLRKVVENVRMRELYFREMERGNNPFGIASLIESLVPFLPDFQTLGELGSDRSDYLKSHTTDRLELLQKIATLMGHQYWRYARLMTVLDQQMRGLVPVPDDLCFGGNSKEPADTLDFIMWRDHADRLGIKLTDADLAREINREATSEVFDLEKLDFEKNDKIQAFLRRGDVPNVQFKDFIEALRDEFRVSMAQSILLGGEPGIRAYRSMIAPASPASVTPEEFLEYFRHNRTTLKVEMLPISSEKYLAQVKESPTEEEIKSRFERFKDKEALPGSRDPGFKESRRVVVQYLTADATNPQHRKAAKYLTAYFTDAALAQRTFETLLTAPSRVGAGPLGPIAAVATAAALDPIGPEYDQYVREQGHYLYPILPSLEREREDDSRAQERFRQEALYSPRALISLMGSLSRGPLVALGDHQLNVTWIGFRHWLRQAGGVHLRLGSLHSQADLFGAAALAVTTSPEIHSRHHVAPVLLTSLEDRLARDLLRAQFDTITRELARLPKDKEPAIEKYLQQALKDYPALKLYVMPASKAQLMLAEELERRTDPKLNELLEPLRKLMPVSNEREFVATLFSAQNVYEARRGALPDMPQQFRRQHFDPEFESTEALWWLKENHAAKSPKSLSEPGVRDKIILAWKMDRARALASAEADKLVREINQKVAEGKWTPSDAQRLLREQKAKIGSGEPFDLENVSRLVPAARLQMGGKAEYRRYEIPPDKKSLMPHEPGDLADQLLILEKEGRAAVVADGPLQTFYVAVLLARTEPGLTGKDGFFDVYARGARTDPLYNFFVRERTQEYRYAVTKSLREEAGKVNKEGRFDVPEEFRKRENRDEME